MSVGDAVGICLNIHSSILRGSVKEVLALGDSETWNPENSLVWMITCKPITDRKNHWSI